MNRLSGKRFCAQKRLLEKGQLGENDVYLKRCNLSLPHFKWKTTPMGLNVKAGEEKTRQLIQPNPLGKNFVNFKFLIEQIDIP